MKLLIGIPTVDYIHFKFVECLTKLEKRLNELGIDYDIYFKHCTMIHLGRDEIAMYATRNNYDKLLWIDADMVFASDIFEKLNSINAPYVCGLFVSRHGSKGSCLFQKLNPPVRITKYSTEPFKIKASGFGCVLTDADMLSHMFRKFNTCFLPIQGFGEDLSFGKRVDEAGYTMMCNPEAIFGHIGQAVVWPDKDCEFI